MKESSLYFYIYYTRIVMYFRSIVCHLSVTLKHHAQVTHHVLRLLALSIMLS